jgi:hypothetical protein
MIAFVTVGVLIASYMTKMQTARVERDRRAADAAAN